MAISKPFCNTNSVSIDTELFLEGWERRSAAMLDLAGCPTWLVKLRCPAMPGWGHVLDALERMARIPVGVSPEEFQQKFLDLTIEDYGTE